MLKRTETAMLAGFAALAPLAIDMYLPAMPPLANDLGVSFETAGQSIAIFLFGVAGGQLVSGPLSDRMGRRPVVLAGLVAFLLASVAAAMTTQFAVLLLARLAQALGACSVMVSGRAIVRDRLDATESARFFSLLALIGGLAPVLAPLLGAGVIHFASWRAIFAVMAGFGALLLLAALPGLIESRSARTQAKAAQEHPFAAYGALLRQRALLGYLLAAMFNSAGFFAYVANSSLVLVGHYHLTPAGFSLVFGINSVALVGASQLNRALLRRHGIGALLAASGRNALVLAVLFAGFALTGLGGLPALALLLFVMVGSVSPVQSNTMAGGLAVDPLRAGSAAALFGAATFAAGALASWCVGLLSDGSARALCLVIAACLVGAGMSIRLLVTPATPKPQPAA